jgi:uncharacterized protein (TIGR00255 family)
MSIVSMTGFGRSEFKTAYGPIRVELKSFNQKFFELSSRMPHELNPFAERIRKSVQSKIRRGKVYLNISAPDALLSPAKLYLNEPLAKQYLRALRRLNKSLGLNQRIDFNQIVRLPDIFSRSLTSQDMNRVWRRTERTLQGALALLDRSRKKEGRTLAMDLKKRVHLIETRLRHIKRLAPKVVNRYRQKILNRLQSNKKAANSKERLNQEVATFARGVDITEEVVRMASHLQSLKVALTSGGEVGRKMDFIAQEMVRETNTMGAKSNDYKISDHVIHIKAELEKIREQLQNIE